MIEIIQRHMVGGQLHEHIAEVRYKDERGAIRVASREQMVTWLDASNINQAIVKSITNPAFFVYVGTVHPQHGPAYIRTYADKKWTDNLLALPEY